MDWFTSTLTSSISAVNSMATTVGASMGLCEAPPAAPPKPTKFLRVAPKDQDAKTVPGTMRRSTGEDDIKDTYSEISGTMFNVRGPTYLVDSIKQPSEESFCELAAVDTVTYPTAVSHIAELDDPGTFKKLPADSEYLIVNFQVPCTEYVVHWVTYWRLPKETPENKRALALLKRYMDPKETKEFRDARFKVIPTVHTGPWLVASALGATPAILPNKLTTTYCWGERHFEMDVDVGSSIAASYLVNLIKSYIVELELDVAMLIECKQTSELPETIIGAIRAHHVNILQGIHAMKIGGAPVGDKPASPAPLPPKPAAAAPAPKPTTAAPVPAAAADKPSAPAPKPAEAAPKPEEPAKPQDAAPQAN